MPRGAWRALATATPVLLLLAAALPGRAQTLGRFETQDLRLVYTKGGESFLVPHAARTFENSMGFQRRMFDYRPLQKVPVLLFLGLLVFLDSFKLVSLRSVLVALVAWALAALAGTQANGWLLDATGLPTHAFSRYVAPLVEETLKALWIVLLLRRGRVGFLVDAAILGFAVGAGFALVENVEYLRALAEPRVLLWLARGFGTAILHGATTAVLALLAKMLADRHPGRPVLALVPGLLAAACVHSLYNQFLVSPLLAAGVILIVLPLLVVAVFERSERATREWLGVGLDSDLELFESIASGQALGTRLGEYLRSLKTRFPGEVVADMLCLLRIQAESDSLRLLLRVDAPRPGA